LKICNCGTPQKLKRRWRINYELIILYRMDLPLQILYHGRADEKIEENLSVPR